jgi:hypothetical protein
MQRLAPGAGRLRSPPRCRPDLAGAAWLAAALLALVVPLTFGADAGWPAWPWPVAAAGVTAPAVFARHDRALAGNDRLNSVAGLPAPLRILCRLTREPAIAAPGKSRPT